MTSSKWDKYYREGVPEAESPLEATPSEPIWWMVEIENGHTIKVKAQFAYEACRIAGKHGSVVGIRKAASDDMR